MRREHRHRVVAVIVVLLTAPLATAACALPAGDSAPGGTSAPEPSTSTTVIPPEWADSLGVTAAGLSADQAARAISRETALEIAGREGGIPPSAGTPEMYLVRMTDPGAHFTDRPVWLVVYTGLSLPAPKPPPAPDPGPLTTAWVYIDAMTGEWLVTVMGNQG